MTDELPSLADLPTQPPPPPHVESRDSRKRPLASRVANPVTRPLSRLMVLLLLMQSALSGSAYLVTEHRPSFGVALAVLLVANVIWAWSLVTMLTLLGRGR